MAESNKDQAERISFASAKSLFEKDKAKTLPKSHSSSPSLNSYDQKPRNAGNGDTLDRRARADPLQSGQLKHAAKEGPIEYTISSLPSFDSSAEGQKSNFIIPKKRGDTSDLRWLTTVHNSRPVGTQLPESSETSSRKPQNQLHSSATVPRSVSADGHPSGATGQKTTGNRAILSSKPNNSSASRDYPDAQLSNLSNSKSTTRDAARNTNPSTGSVASAGPATSQVLINGRAPGATEKTPVVKSSMTVSLNVSGTDGTRSKDGAALRRGVSDRAHGAANPGPVGFSAVLAEIQNRKAPSENEQAKTNAAGSSILIHPAQKEISMKAPASEKAPKSDKVDGSQKVPILANAPESSTLPSVGHEHEDGHRRTKLAKWNPTKLMKELYKITLQPEVEFSGDYINIEGHLEKLPISKTKDTFLKTWKRRYFRAHNGTLHYYESGGEKKESGNFKLNGGTVEEIGERMLGIEDGRGHHLILRCASDKDFSDWWRALQSQTVEGIPSSWVKPILKSTQTSSKKVIVLELGSCAIRAGILGESLALPDVFLPMIAATDNNSGQMRFCFDALSPEVRAKSTIFYPVQPTAKVDKYSIDWNSMPGLFDHVFRSLNVDPSQYSIMFSIPTNLNDGIKSRFMDLFVDRFKVLAVSMVCQTILSLYSYNATSGVVIDIGDHIEILPVADGYAVEGGVMRVAYGGQMITDALNRSFTDRRYRFTTDIEFQIIRLAMEKLCYLSDNYESEMKRFQQNPDQFQATLPLDAYDLPSGSFKDISNDFGRFKSPEGLFDTFFWGLDNPPLQEMTLKAIQACPIDMRRPLWRSIYLSGGVTQLEGFVDRLQKELSKLAPSGVVVQVHAAPNRYHSSYLGAATLALMPAFKEGCITAKEWRQGGATLLKKWKAY